MKRVATLALLLAACAGSSYRQQLATESARPGLGTSWGEERSSRVTTVPFDRDSGDPCGERVLHYDDARGITAMVRHDVERGFAELGIDGGGDVTISVVGDDGRALPTLLVGERVFIIGGAGEHYALQVSNDGPRRYEIVASVDGLDVIDGRDASFDKRGYVVEPYGRLSIDGFRTSDASVASFRFGGVEDSYAARTTGSSRNVGVIGVALFCESAERDDEVELRESADPFPG
jgi:hypothetical protein